MNPPFPSREFHHRSHLILAVFAAAMFAGAAWSAPADSAIEGTWEGKDLGTWTFQVLRDLGSGALLIDSGEDDYGLLEVLPQENAWIFIQGATDSTPEDCSLWRLEIVNGKLFVGAYEPRAGNPSYEVGRFKIYVCAKVKPLAQRRAYEPRGDTDDHGKPIDWLKLYHQRIQARAAEMAVLRLGGLEPARELSRRREWAAAQAKDSLSEFYHVVERMASEQGCPEDKVDKEKAQGRTLERWLNSQYYDYGSRPPGFRNCAAYQELNPATDPDLKEVITPDFEARQRRAAIILWNLRQNLELMVKDAQTSARRTHGLMPEQKQAALEDLRASVKEQKERIAEIQERIAGLREDDSSRASLEAAIRSRQEDIEDSNKRMANIEGDICHRANDQGGYDFLPLATILAEERKKVEDDFQMPQCLRGIAQRLDGELPATTGHELSLAGGDASAVGGDCQIELPEGRQGVRRPK